MPDILTPAALVVHNSSLVFKRPYNAFPLSGARRTQTFKPNLLAMSNKALLQTLDNRNRHPHQTARQSALFASEMRVTSNGATAIRKLKMPRSFLHKSLMYQAGPAETLQGAVNRDFIEPILAQSLRNLFLLQWSVRLQQNFQYGHSAFCAIKIYGF